MQAVQSVAAQRRLDPGQAADEDQLKQDGGTHQQPGQPAEGDGGTARLAIEEQVTRDLPPDGSHRHGVGPAGCSKPPRGSDQAHTGPWTKRRADRTSARMLRDWPQVALRAIGGRDMLLVAPSLSLLRRSLTERRSLARPRARLDITVPMGMS